jgi:hypothetical protein
VCRDQLEQQVGCFGFERDVADFVDDQQRHTAEFDQFVLEPVAVVGRGETVDPSRGGGERDAVSSLAGADPQPDRQVRLAVPGGPRKTTFCLEAMKSSVPRCAI